MTEGAQRYGDSSAFMRLILAHEEMHRMAARCCTLHDHDQSASIALNALSELQREFNQSLKTVERETSDRLDESVRLAAPAKIGVVARG